jgi:hypothetical protein
MEAEVKAVTEALRTATLSIAGASSRLATAETALTGHLATAEGAAQGLLAQVEALTDAQERLRAASTSLPSTQPV